MSEAAVRLAAPLILVLALAAGILLGSAGIESRGAEDAASESFVTLVDALPEDALVLVGFDPDLGTYAEIRPTVRTLLADLIARGARLAIVSLTPEGRALAIAEGERLERVGAGADRVVDLGFLPGAEAGLVVVAGAVAGSEPLGPPSGSVDLGDSDLVVVIGGNDLGPRSWVEQVAPRIGPIPIAAVTPTILIPEVQPYLLSGQLAALITTPTEGAAFRDEVDLGASAALGDPAGPSRLAIAAGLVIAIAWLLTALVRALAPNRAAHREGDGS